MEKCEIDPLGYFNNPKYVVSLSKYQGQCLFSRHQTRLTWETQGGHIEPGESALDAAKRELYEKSGAVSYKIRPAFEYCHKGSGDSGVVFVVNIYRLAPLPGSEITQVQMFKALAQNLTYPAITPVLIQETETCFSWYFY